MKGLSALEQRIMGSDQFEGPPDYTARESAAIDRLLARGLIRRWYCDRCEADHFDVTAVGATLLAIAKGSP
jgi:hypothetical protein